MPVHQPSENGMDDSQGSYWFEQRQVGAQPGNRSSDPKFIPALELRPSQLLLLLGRTAELAVEFGASVALLGRDEAFRIGDSSARRCFTRCCWSQPGCLVVVPDVLLMQRVANGKPVPSTWAIELGGAYSGRSARIFAGGPETLGGLGGGASWGEARGWFGGVEDAGEGLW